MLIRQKPLTLRRKNMAKNGHTMADRKKVESVAVAKTIQPSECGKVFILQSGSAGDGSYQLTLPAASEAGAGWWAKFVLGAADGGNVIVTGSSSDATAFYVQGVSASGSAAPLSGIGSFRFDVSGNDCAINDSVEVVSSGTAWYCQAITSGSLAVVENS